MGESACDRRFCPACDLAVSSADERCPECGARIDGSDE
jgi:RNA polymerase subunit RPABC4/transcription elongation factor Spt4